MEKNLVVAIGLYGMLDETREEIEGYKMYLHLCARAVANRVHRLKAVILCGGHTNPKLPNLSEAASVYNYFLEQLRHCGINDGIPLTLEDQSLNTPQNIQNALDIINKKYPEVRVFEFFCDRVRWIKSFVITARLTKRMNIKFRVSGFPRPDIHPHSKYYFQFLAAIAYFLFPKLLRKHLDAKPV